MLKCFLDIDGVLTDFPLAYNDRFGLAIPFEKFAEHEFAKVVGKSIEQIDAELDRQFWATLPWMPRGRELLGLLESYFGASNICLLSFPSYSPDGPAGKFDWVRENLPEYRMRLILATDKRFCAGPDRILYDDKQRNIREFIAAGGAGVLVPAPWNKHGCYWYEKTDKLVEQLERLIWSGRLAGSIPGQNT